MAVLQQHHRLQWYVLWEDDNEQVKTCVDYKVKDNNPRSRPIITWKEVVTEVKGGTVHHTALESVGRCSYPSHRSGAHRWKTSVVCDAWPVRCQTCCIFPAARHHRPLAGTNYTAW